MVKKLFGFIGRKKRIAQKMHLLGQYIRKMDEQDKPDFALNVAEDVAAARNDRKLEEIADFYIQEVQKPLNNHRD